MAVMGTLASWVGIFSLVGVYWYFFSSQAKNRRIPAVLKGVTKEIESRTTKPKKSRREGGPNSGDQDVKSGAKSQKKKPQASKIEQEESRPLATKGTDGDDEVNNREFARQFASVQSGTIIAPKSQAASKQKSVKQSRAQEKPPVETSSDNATAPSSATGGDADDDQSSLNSPELSATSMASPVTVRNSQRNSFAYGSKHPVLSSNDIPETFTDSQIEWRRLRHVGAASCRTVGPENHRV